MALCRGLEGCGPSPRAPPWLPAWVPGCRAIWQVQNLRQAPTFLRGGPEAPHHVQPLPIYASQSPLEL